jgi:phosphinothricin acetyltransferase
MEAIMSKSKIRMATLEDAEAIQAIYKPYILNTAITFEYEPISVEAFQERMETVMSQFPWLVYEEDGKVIGYAYCSRFKERAAFGWDCECSVYIDEKAHHRGIATALYQKLFGLIEKQGYYNIYALINNNVKNSVALHKKFGFEKQGLYEKTGYKMGQWQDLIIMVKRLRSFDQIPQKTKSIQEIRMASE